jgi:GNAT superfamily N-acetyltransferase
MFEIKRLNEISLDEAVEIWNQGFEGYFSDITMNVDSFTTRLVNEEMSAKLSIVGYIDGKPAGIVLNGIRMINGKKVAWNGGTGVPVKFRGTGIGKQLMQATFDIYKEEGVELATLEAMSQNERAIKLYESIGYQVMDRLVFLQKAGKLSQDVFKTEKQFQFTKGIALDARSIEILNNNVPWQTQWQSLRKDGELAVVSDGEEEIAYFLYKRGYRANGDLGGITLYQANVNPKHHNLEDAIRYGLKKVFEPEVDCTRMTFNFPNSNKEVINILKEEGFESKLEQVYMEKRMDDSIS